MKPRDYEKAWLTLKEDMLEDYVSRHEEVIRFEKRNGQYHQLQAARAMIGKNKLQGWLKRMDYLDGTHEFSNLKHDLERGGK